MCRYSLERTVKQIELNSELVAPVRDAAASEYKMKLVSQAVDESLHNNQVNVNRAALATFEDKRIFLSVLGAKS